MAAPPAIMATMAATLMSENQNSSSPKTLTLSRFSAARKKMIARIQTQRSTCGNQKPM
jgi:N-acyl-L-homoserine lactone synthetase